MSGRLGQIVKYYKSPRLNQSGTYKKVLFYLLDITVRNTFYLYRKRFNQQSMTFKDSRDIFIKNIIKLPINVNAHNLFNAPKSHNPKRTVNNTRKMTLFRKNFTQAKF